MSDGYYDPKMVKAIQSLLDDGCDPQEIRDIIEDMGYTMPRHRQRGIVTSFVANINIGWRQEAPSQIVIVNPYPQLREPERPFFLKLADMIVAFIILMAAVIFLLLVLATIL